MSKIKSFFWISGLICFVVFLLHLFIVGTAVYGDGRYYYATTRSLVLDGNLDFTNEYTFFKINEHQLPTGFQANKYPPGPSFLWVAPFFIIHNILLFLLNFGLTFPADGYSFPYQIVVGFTSIIFLIIGIYILFKTLTFFFDKKTSLLASLTVLFATNLFFYSSVDVINSHAVSFTLSAFLLYFLFTFKNNDYKKWLICGLTVGLLMLTRTQDIILLILPLSILICSKLPVLKKLKALALLIGGIFLTFIPQLLIWKTIYGSFLLSPYFNRIESFNFLKPQISGVLFNSNTGLILWTPFILLGFIGLFLFKNNLKYLRFIFITVVLVQFYLIASWSSWNQGASFGTRMLISCLPVLAFGFASLYKIYLQKYSLKSLIYLIVFSSLINFSLIILYLIKH